MTEKLELNDPWLLAVWPGMGHVALNAGLYLVAKLAMRQIAHLSSRDLFDVEHIEIEEGIVKLGPLPQNRFFVWQDPKKKHDLIVFVGEAQPSTGRYGFCHRLLDAAMEMGVKRFFTFAAIATQLHPATEPHVTGVATDGQALKELQEEKVKILEDGQIGGLNGVLLGAGTERGLRGIGLLGEIPFFASQLPNPKASKAVLEIFLKMIDIDVDLSDIQKQADAMEIKLTELFEKMKSALQDQSGEQDFTLPGFVNDPEADDQEPKISREPVLGLEARERIEKLFERSRRDRSHAVELKQELDRLGVFAKYEDRFLDLFKKAE
jgi:proteasome assembly chaperone (PAC2) family protein